MTLTSWHNSSKHTSTYSQANVSEALCSGVFASEDTNADGILAREVEKNIPSLPNSSQAAVLSLNLGDCESRIEESCFNATSNQSMALIGSCDVLHKVLL